MRIRVTTACHQDRQRGESMELSFGRHQGRTVEELVLKEPGYLMWMLTQPSPTGEFARAVHEARRLIAVFDAKPFVRACYGTDCKSLATRFSAYRQSTELFFWCGECDPCELGAWPTKITILKTYLDA